MTLNITFEFDKEASTPFSQIEETLKGKIKELSLQYPAEVVKYEFGIDPHTDDKGKEHPFEPPRPCIRWGLHRTCAKIEAGQLKAERDFDISSVIAHDMLFESRNWYQMAWPDTKRPGAFMEFKIASMDPGGSMATDPKRRMELSREGIDRSVNQYKPENKERIKKGGKR